MIERLTEGKTDKYSNSNKVSAPCNHTASKTMVDKNIDLPDNSCERNFVYPLLII